MNNQVLQAWGMPFNRNLDPNLNGFLLGKGGNQIGWIKKMSTYNFQELNHIDIW